MCLTLFMLDPYTKVNASPLHSDDGEKYEPEIELRENPYSWSKVGLSYYSGMFVKLGTISLELTPAFSVRRLRP